MNEKPTCGECRFCERRDRKMKDEDGILRDTIRYICVAKHLVLEDIHKAHFCSRYEEIEAEDVQNEYLVTISATATVSMFIRAEDEFDARDKAQEMDIDPEEWDIDDRMVVETTLVKESMIVGKYPETEKKVERTMPKSQTKLF